MSPRFRGLHAMGWPYQILHALAFLGALPWYAATRGGARKYSGVLGPRFGRPPLVTPPGSLWVQAVSVGEVGVAEILAAALLERQPELALTITTTTTTGQERARGAFPDATVGYFPFDFAPVARAAVDRLHPRGFVMLETEIWPGILEALGRRQVPIVLANARISDRSLPRYRRAAPFLRSSLNLIDLALAASEQDAERLLAIGMTPDRVEVTGNLKFDRQPDQEALPWEADRHRVFEDRPVLVAGSTAPGEEQGVLAAFLDATGPERRAGLILAPRHPNRFDEVASLIAASGLRWCRRSSFDDQGRVPTDAGPVDVLLLDTLGELARVYPVGPWCLRRRQPGADWWPESDRGQLARSPGRGRPTHRQFPRRRGNVIPRPWTGDHQNTSGARCLLARVATRASSGC